MGTELAPVDDDLVADWLPLGVVAGQGARLEKAKSSPGSSRCRPIWKLGSVLEFPLNQTGSPRDQAHRPLPERV
jgi:hypothetical protein